MKTLFIVYLALVVLALSACQKTETDATVPGIDAQCVNNPNLCQQNIYNTPGYTPYNYNNGYNNNGFNGSYNGGNYNYGGGYYQGNYNYSYGYNVNPFRSYNNSNYLCNCPTGSVPTYNSYAGLGCVQTSQIYGYSYAYFGWSSGANNNQWVNIPQISNHVGYTGSGSCYNGVIQSCLVDQPNTCSVGYSCQSSSASSRVGLCIATNAAGNGNGSYGPVVR